jgi:hypothetical protein
MRKVYKAKGYEIYFRLRQKFYPAYCVSEDSGAHMSFSSENKRVKAKFRPKTVLEGPEGE